MNSGRTVFAQWLDFVPSYEFKKCVERYQGNYKVQTFSCWDQFICMCFAQLTYQESLRDIEACLRSTAKQLYHVGMRGRISRNNLAHANETRDWRIYADFAQILIAAARELYAQEDLGLELETAVYALDATVIDLCLSLFPWAKFRRRKAAVKLHTLLDLRGSIPAVISITTGRVHEVKILDQLELEAGAIYIMDRAYLDFARLYRFHQAQSFFITRAKSNFVFKRQLSRPVDKAAGVQVDQIINLGSFYPRKAYPERLRRIRYFDDAAQKRLVFLTNNFTLPAPVIAQLYKCRWQVETFFRWIKQHLRIKAFYGTTANAVKTQIWIAISVYVLMAIIKKRLQLEPSLHTILRILSIKLFEKKPILQALALDPYQRLEDDDANQLILFD